MIGYLFPGQGSQISGMLHKMGEYYREVQSVFSLASEIANKDVAELCLSKTEAELRKTENTQIAVTAMNMAYLQLLQNRGMKPDIVMGHSLGQFSALVASGVMTMETVFQIICKRAELMSEISVDGSLSTVIGLNYNKVSAVCHMVSVENETVSIALHNTSEQIVIGGNRLCVSKASQILKENGALRVVENRVSNAFHTRLMERMVFEFTNYIQKINLFRPECKIILNCKGDYAENIEEIRKDIIEQCCHTVKWYESLKLLLANRDIILAEVGAGKTLAGMIRNMNRRQNVFLLSERKHLETFLHNTTV
ncbi:MAG: ACP S-malonyltransferase [Hungatella sp.]|jgi:[acyl-carrier-protein] S-malonyltransferase|nr:ACP S-malonyltransferase [Hungatella sp.]